MRIEKTEELLEITLCRWLPLLSRHSNSHIQIKGPTSRKIVSKSSYSTYMNTWPLKSTQNLHLLYIQNLPKVPIEVLRRKGNLELLRRGLPWFFRRFITDLFFSWEFLHNDVGVAQLIIVGRSEAWLIVLEFMYYLLPSGISDDHHHYSVSLPDL